MKKYHINPETGNANICRANIQCPYAAIGDPHFNDKSRAQSYFENQMKNPMSRGAELAIRRSRIQTELNFMLLNDDFNEKIIGKISGIRNNIDRALFNLNDSNDWHGDLKKEVKITDHQRNHNSKSYIGIDNNLSRSINDDNVKNMIHDFKDASDIWVSTLSNNEIKAVFGFSGSNESYKSYSDLDNSKYFSSALQKSPHFTKPITVYSGLSDQMKKAFENTVPGKTITLERGISTSLNPGQVNGFSHGDTAEERCALIVEAHKGAPMYSVSSNPHELEIVLNSGDFEIVEIEEDIHFAYTQEMRSLKYGKVFKIRQL